MDKMMDPASGGTGLIAALKLKLGYMLPAAIGATIMMATRPPKDRKSVFMFAVVALGSSFLFGNQIAWALDPYIPWVDLATSPVDKKFDYHVAVHGVVGALGWAFWGIISTAYEKLKDDPVGTLKSLWTELLKRLTPST